MRLLLHIVIILLLHGLIAGGVFGFSAVSGGYQYQYQYQYTRHHHLSSLQKMSTSSEINLEEDTAVDSSNNNNNNMIHWAIIGLGDVCTIKSGPAFYKCHGSTLSAVMRRTPNAAKQWITNNTSSLPKEVAKSIRGYDTIEDMIHSEILCSSSRRRLDAIYIATPPSAHLENIRQIIQALDTLPITTSNNNNKSSIIKAIYVEKPCGRCAWETRAIVEELKQRGIQFYPAYVSRAHERTVLLKRLLSDEQVCGNKIVSVKYTQVGNSFARGLDTNDDGSILPWRLNAKQSGGGLIMDMGCHVLDRIDYLFGPIEGVKSTVLRKGGGDSEDDDDDVVTLTSYPLVEDYVSMKAIIGECNWSAIDSKGATVECIWDFSPNEDDDTDVDELVIEGANGYSLRMAGMGAGMPINVLDSNGNVVKTYKFEAPMHAAQPLIQTIVDELRGGLDNDDISMQCPARADNAIRTSEVLDSILGTYYGGRHDEFWLRSDTWPGLK